MYKKAKFGMKNKEMKPLWRFLGVVYIQRHLISPHSLQLQQYPPTFDLKVLPWSPKPSYVMARWMEHISHRKLCTLRLESSCIIDRILSICSNIRSSFSCSCHSTTRLLNDVCFNTVVARRWRVVTTP